MGYGTLTDRITPRRGEILGVILAGGQSRRFGSDKAIAQLGDRRLIEHVAVRAARQTGALFVSGRDYGLGVPVIPDAEPGQGPLGGVLSALQWARAAGFSAIATFSCDAPFFPSDLVARVAEGLRFGKGCSFAMSRGVRHPTFAVWDGAALDRLQGIYDGGIRGLKVAQDRFDATGVLFPSGPGPHGDMFFNINSRDDQVTAQIWLADHPACDLVRSRQDMVL